MCSSIPFHLFVFASRHIHEKDEKKAHGVKEISSNVISHFVPLFFCFSFCLKITNGIFHFVHIFLHNIFLSQASPASSFVFVFSLFLSLNKIYMCAARQYLRICRYDDMGVWCRDKGCIESYVGRSVSARVSSRKVDL